LPSLVNKAFKVLKQNAQRDFRNRDSHKGSSRVQTCWRPKLEAPSLMTKIAKPPVQLFAFIANVKIP